MIWSSFKSSYLLHHAVLLSLSSLFFSFLVHVILLSIHDLSLSPIPLTRPPHLSKPNEDKAISVIILPTNSHVKTYKARIKCHFSSKHIKLAFTTFFFSFFWISRLCLFITNPYQTTNGESLQNEEMWIHKQLNCAN